MHVLVRASHQKLNLGLCLKFDSRGQKVLGYSRKTEKGWEFTQRAVNLIEEYRKFFPTLFVKLDRSSNTDYFEDVDLFPTDTKESITRVQNWLASKGVKQFLAVSLSSMTLTKVFTIN